MTSTGGLEDLTEDVRSSALDFLPLRIWTGFFLGVMVSLGLAFSYVYGGGIELLDQPNFRLLDSYIYNTVFVVGGVGVAGSFYAYYRDVSSTVAVLLGMVWALISGLQDVFVYLLLPSHSMPSVLPWLNDSKIGIVASWLGFEQVTPLAIGVVIVFEFAVLLFLSKILVGFEKRFLGVDF